MQAHEVGVGQRFVRQNYPFWRCPSSTLSSARWTTPTGGYSRAVDATAITDRDHLTARYGARIADSGQAMVALDTWPSGRRVSILRPPAAWWVLA